MPPKLILHAGTHKTGTTAIQAFAARHAEALAARGLIYPDLAPLGRAFEQSQYLFYPHHVFAHALADADKEISAADAARLAELWAEDAAARDATVFLSSEPLYRHGLTGDGEDGKRRGARARYLDRLAAALAPFETEVVLVFRRPEDFVRSLFQENVMRAPRAKWASFAEFRARVLRGPLRYAENAALFAERFARVRCLVYEDLPSGPDFCGRFFEAIGVDATGLEPVGTVRESLGTVETAIKLFLDKILVAEKNGKLRKLVKSPAVAELAARHLGPGPFSLWESPAARASFIESMRPEVEQLRARFFADRAELFPPAATETPPAVPAFSRAFRAQLAQQAAEIGLTRKPRPPKAAAPAAPAAPAAAARTAVETDPLDVVYRFPHTKDASWNSFDRQRARYQVIRDFLGEDAVGAEIGVYKGGFGEFLLGHCRKLYLVDTWYRSAGFWPSKIKNDSRVASVINILKVYQTEIEKGQVEVVIDSSTNFLKTVENAHFDFVYIDTSHKYEDTLKEIEAVVPKIKRGGHLFGDDYDPDPASRNHGVYRAVNEFLATSGAEMVVNDSRQWGVAIR